jgi:hypothetical protein
MLTRNAFILARGTTTRVLGLAAGAAIIVGEVVDQRRHYLKTFSVSPGLESQEERFHNLLFRHH